jgi:hypothetical protein
VHPTLINRWKKELHEGGRTIFVFPKRKERETEVLQAALYEEIGRLKFELDWLKKKLLLDYGSVVGLETGLTGYFQLRRPLEQLREASQRSRRVAPVQGQ